MFFHRWPRHRIRHHPTNFGNLSRDLNILQHFTIFGNTSQFSLSSRSALTPGSPQRPLNKGGEPLPLGDCFPRGDKAPNECIFNGKRYNSP